MMKRTIFRPILTVDDQGMIDISFDECEEETIDENGDPVEYDSNGSNYNVHSQFLDSLVANVPTYVALRRIADAIEMEQKTIFNADEEEK